MKSKKSWEGKVGNLKTMRRARTQLHRVRSVSGITIRRRCDLPRCNNITRSLAYFLADTKLAKLNADLYPRVLEEFKIERSNLEIVTI